MRPSEKDEAKSNSSSHEEGRQRRCKGSRGQIDVLEQRYPERLKSLEMKSVKGLSERLRTAEHGPY